MFHHRSIVLVISVLCLFPGSPAAADFILTDASRDFDLEVGDMNFPDTFSVSIPGFGPLNESHSLSIPGIAATATQDTWINATSFGGTFSSLIFSTEAGHYAFSATSVFVLFDLDTPTTVTTSYDITGFGDELTQGFYFLTRNDVPENIFGGDGDFVGEVTLTLEPGSYALELGFWLGRVPENPLVGTTTKTGVFDFTIIPAPATAIPLLLALVIPMRRRRRKFDNS